MNQPLMILAGGTGFLGRHLARYFWQLGYEVLTLTRRVRRFGEVAWNGRTLGPWAAKLEGAAALINLAGRSVDCRYHPVNRYAITRSRTDSTRVLAEAVAQCRQPPAVWLNLSTATIYEDTAGEAPANTEATGRLGRGFSERVAQQWEAEFWLTPTPHTRRAALRTAVVLGPDGGALPTLARLARWGLCTPHASGQQWVSWLHVADFCRAVEFLLTRPELTGAYNLCAPEPLQNQALMHLLADHYRPKWHIPQPRWLLELGALLLQTETELLLKSRNVVPQRLLAAGFRFQYPAAPAALADLLPQLPG